MKKKTRVCFNSISDHSITEEHHASDVGLSPEEYERIKRLLTRAPNKVELGIVGALWSEHCSYKSTRAHLSKLPTTGPHVLVGPGENAGAVDIGDDLALIFKIESHNHPSFIEPFQGAATGVGGILRDIFTMGARPFATANLLRFGAPVHQGVSHLFHGVVGGIANYGNCFGVPTVLSDVDFHESYNGNNLVNAFAIGVVNKHEIFLGSASGVKNRILYVGAKTGRDGIMGAVMASDVFADDTEQKRPTVQVGDPFTEKLLLEACLLAFKEKLIVGIQDMGAAGMTSSSFEMANRASTGLSINLDHVPLRDGLMHAYDIMLSESQERMLMVVTQANAVRVKEIFAKFELDCVDIGYVTGDGLVRISHNGHEVVNLSATLIIENAPRYRRTYLSKIPCNTLSIKDKAVVDMSAAIESFKKDLGQRDLSWITNQFDHHIGLNTVVGPNEADAVLIRVPHSKKAVAISLLCNGKLCKLNPYEGARRTVFNAALQISAQGASPVGMTNCLNFGSPENTAVMTDLKHVIDGMAHAAISLNTPIISGNVSLYNETNGRPILPSMALGLVGLTDKPTRHTKFSRAEDGDLLVLLGDLPDDYAGCETVFCDTPMNISLGSWESEQLLNLCEVISRGVNDGLFTCASVIGRGGLLHSLIKIMAHTNIGVALDFGSEWLSQELTLGLLSEDSPRVLVSISEQRFPALAKECAKKISINRLGRVEGAYFSISHHGKLVFREPTFNLTNCFKNGLEDDLANH